MLKIDDNGLGRKKASENKDKKKNNTEHQSYATQILKERIDVLNYLHKEKSVFRLEDINSNGQVVGTRAILILPKVKPKNK